MPNMASCHDSVPIGSYRYLVFFAMGWVWLSWGTADT